MFREEYLDKKKVYLHIGLSKTGTSAIQNFLYKSKKTLIKKYKILYPDTGILAPDGIFAHHGIAFSIYKPEEAKGLKVTEFETIKECLLKESIAKKSKICIISSEAFMHFRDKHCFEILKILLEQFLEKCIIVYLRRQDLWHESSYSQVVKDFGIRLTCSFKESTQHSLTLNWLLNYNSLLSRWQQAFPESKIIPRIYDRKLFPDGNVILDFLSILGIEMPEARDYKVETNPSLSHLSILVMRKINEKFNLTREEHGKCIQYLFKLDREEGSPIRSFFTLPERIEFLEHFRESNERLFREWFGTENQFVLSEEEIKFYEEQDRISRKEIEKLVEDRYRRVLTFLKEEKDIKVELI
ncbi:MAG: hypothetical protein RMJ67_05295 [Elusimicrobiota bacterium]|nr:hypothetical protein [Endomicrobiia bacterium]MDW8165905.1 hypothetical protein [Elusimicrobiota bacterium]